MNKLLTTCMKFFKDRKGRIAIVQTPNVPLIGWFLFVVSTHVLHTATWQEFAGFMSFGFIFTWSWLEITQGANYFRRALGLVVLFVSIYSRVR